MLETIKKSFFAGIIIIIPIALTVYVLRALFDMSLAVGEKIAEPLTKLVGEQFPSKFEFIRILLSVDLFNVLLKM